MSRSTTSYDLVIIGGGPGGYPCAIRASQLGLSVAVIDDRELLGGTCLNIGCIPSKALLQATERLEMARNLEAFGVMVDNVRADLDGVMRHKGKVVTELGEGVAYLLRKHKVARFQGRGRLLARDRVEVRAADGAFEVQASKAVVIASGSEAATLPDLPIDERRIVTSAGALSLTAAPRHLAVIGGGYVGLELGSVWRRLGSEVTVIEVLDRIASGVDSEMSAALHKVLEAPGFQFCLGHQVVGSRMEGDDVVLDVEPMGDGARGTIKADVVLVSIGRRPATARLDLETVGIAPDRRGFIPVDEGFRTSADGVYAIGDVIGGAMLAHKAEEEGIALAERLAGGAGHVDYGTIPAVVYTWPELASVGRTEDDLTAAGVADRVGRFPFSANAMAKARLEKNGLVKVLADARTDKILGVHILGPDAGSLIHEAVAVMQFGAAAEDVARTSHAHPTLPEALREACLAVADRTIHL